MRYLHFISVLLLCAVTTVLSVQAPLNSEKVDIVSLGKAIDQYTSVRTALDDLCDRTALSSCYGKDNHWVMYNIWDSANKNCTCSLLPSAFLV